MIFLVIDMVMVKTHDSSYLLQMFPKISRNNEGISPKLGNFELEKWGWLSKGQNVTHVTNHSKKWVWPAKRERGYVDVV